MLLCCFFIYICPIARYKGRFKRDGFFSPKVTDIYNGVYNRNMPLENMQYQERLILEKVCVAHPEDYHLINDLVSLQKSKTILMNNNGLQGDIEKRLDNYLNQQ